MNDDIEPVGSNPPSNNEKKSFLLEYEGPTQLYRILHHRHQTDPTFLYRNINYQRKDLKLKKPKSRTSEVKGQRLHAITKQLESNGTPVGSSESLCLKFNGVCGVEKEGREFVPATIQFLGTIQNKRKAEGEKVVWEKKTVLMLNPKKGSFSEVVTIPMSDIEHAHKVVFKLEFPERIEPPTKRKKIPQDTKKVRKVFHGLVFATMEIDSPIQAGEYEINIIDETENEASKQTSKRMKWETISGGNEIGILETALPNFAQVRFNLDWVTAICHMKERKSVISNVRKPAQIKIIYQFYYQNRARVLNETRPELRCIWCEKQFYTVQDLLAHLKASHDRFLYSTPESKAIDSKMKINTIHIEVYPNPWKIHSYLGNPNLSESLDIGRCIFYRGSEPIKRTNTKGTQILIWRRRAIHPSAQPDEKGTLDRTECSLITQGHRRLYFHTHSNMPVRACEFEVDSEDDSQQEFRWIRDNMYNQINEFTDVNKDEKLVMQLWNHFLMSRKVLSLPQIAQACIDISHEYGAFIIENNLRRNFLLHLLNLVDHCLLKPSKVPDIMEIIDKGKGKTNPDFTGAREEKEKLEKIINDSTARDYNYFL